MSHPRATAGFTHSGFFVMRTPLLSFDELGDWGSDLEAPGAHDGGHGRRLEAAVARDRLRLQRGLLRAFSRADLREALHLGSPDLHDALESWESEPDSEPPSKVCRALTAYLSRAAARATPFGLFAGCSTGTLAADTRLAVPAPEGCRRHSRLDMDYLWALADAVERDPGVRATLTYRPNSSLYPTPGGLRYAEARQRDGVRSHHLVSVEATPHLLRTLDRARGGVLLDELARSLVDAEVTAAEASAFVDELVDSQILRPDLHPAVTGPEPTAEIVAILERHPPARHIANRLDTARRVLEELDASPPGAPVDTYREIAALFQGLPATPNRSRLFQVDMIKPAPGLSLGEAVWREVLAAVDVLHRLSSGRGGEPLSVFRAAFLERYGDEEVPLMEALDEESGIGVDGASDPGRESAPLLHGIARAGGANEPERWTEREAMLLRWLGPVLRSGALELRLDAADIEALAASTGDRRPPLPDAFHVVAGLAARSAEALGAGDFRICVDHVLGPSGAGLLGRFCHADPLLHDHVVGHLDAEMAADGGRAFAEIAHLPEGRVGNVLCRPVLREYEIPYLGRSGAPPERQIVVTDLRVSVRDDRIVLRSERLGREVVPRLTTAHHVGRGCLGVYRFLAMLQFQGVLSSPSWDWGPLRAAPFLPRVVSGRAVLSRARWTLAETHISTLVHPTPHGRYAAAQALRATLGLPRQVRLADGDNELVADLDNTLSVDTLAGLLRGRRSATLVEMWPQSDELCAHGPAGRYVHELVIPAIRRRDTRRRAPENGRPAGGGALRPACAARRFPPGSEWLYAKLYTGTATADEVLRTAIAPVVGEALAGGAADRWFFLRYGDPEWHLRLRLHGVPERLTGEVLPHLQAAVRPLIGGDRLWRVQFDTYDRELARYGGGEGIAIAEEIFHADSEAALGILRTLHGDAGADARWRLALAGIDMLLSDFGLDLRQRWRWARGRRDAYSRELRVDAALRRRLGERYRAERGTLEAMLDAGHAEEGALRPGLVLLRQRSEAVAAAISRLRALAERGRLTSDHTELAASHAHMHVNRLLRSAHRVQELVIYDLLDRIYLSRIARTAGGAHE